MVEFPPVNASNAAQSEPPHRRLAADLLHIRPGEGRLTALLFIQLFASSGVFILGRTVRDTLFLSRYSVALLPWMFVFYGIGAALVSLGYGRYADRLRRSTLLYATCGLAGVTYLVIWILVRLGVPFVYPLFYIWSEIVSNLLVLQFWTLAAELSHPRDARRLNATIGAARPLGIVFFGIGAGWLVPILGTPQLLFILILLMAAIAACVFKLRHRPRVGSTRRLDAQRDHQSESGLPLEKAYVRALSVLILIMFLALTLGDYQFKIIARASYTEDALARFFSLFYGVVGLLSIAFQLFVTPAVLTKLGVGSALTVMPGVFGSSSAAVLVWPGLPSACAMKFADNGLQFTLHDTTMQSLYSPFSPAARGSTRAFLDGAVKPLSYGAGGLLLVVLLAARFDVRQISLMTVPLALLWLALVPVVRRRYLQLLEKGLAGPMASQLFDEPYVLGATERRILIRTLESPDPASTMVALEQLQNDRSTDFRRALHKLLVHPASAIRARAIQILDSMEDATASGDFAAAARDDSPVVRAAAAAALARIIGEENPEQVLPFLDDQSSEVRVQALASLVRFGGLEGATRAGDRLLRLISSAEPEQRREACQVLSRLGHTAYLPLKRLLQDPNPRVRRAALRAAAGTADSQLLASITRTLYDPATCGTAMATLSAVGDAAVPYIEQAMRDPRLPRATRLQLPRVLSRIPSMKSFVVLRDFQEETDSHVRLRVLAAMGRLRAQLGYAPIPLRALAPRIHREILEAWGNLMAWSVARRRFETRLLAEEMDFRQRRAERRVFRLLELSFDRRVIALVMASLQDPERREEALDTLETLLDAALRELVIPFLEHSASGGAPPILNEPGLSILPPVEFMLLQTYHPNPYVNFLALDAMSRAGEQSAVPAAQEALSHAEPLVREAGLSALARLAPELAQAMAVNLKHDPDPTVARSASYFSRPSDVPNLPQAAKPMEELMQDTVEKILFLKGTPLFSRLPSEDLAPLARVAQVIRFAGNECIFKQNDPGDCFYIVVSGEVVLESEGIELGRVSSPGVLGELAVLDRGRQSCSARALRSSDLLRIGADEFFEILHEQTEIAESLIRILAAEVRDAQHRLVKGNRSVEPPQSPE